MRSIMINSIKRCSFIQPRKCAAFAPCWTHHRSRNIPLVSKTIRCCSSGSPPELSDRELQQSFLGVMPRLEVLFGVLMDNDKFTAMNEELRKYAYKNSPIVDGFRYILYADMQNPLLKKYPIDLVDFMVGAERAFYLVSEGIVSTEFMNFTQGAISESSLQQTLQGVLVNDIYLKCYESLKTYPEMPQVTFKMNNLQIFRVFTEIVPENSLSEYPAGSVLATVHVIFKADETFSKLNEQGDKELEDTRENLSYRWIFRGCISNHTELEWKIVDL